MPGKVLDLCLGHDLSNIKKLPSYKLQKRFSEVPKKETNTLSCTVANSHFAR